MARKFRKKVLLAKIESAYGTDSVPTGAANAILTKNLTINLMQGDTVNRDVDRAALGNDLTYHVGPYTGLSFLTEIAGSGAAGTVPNWGVLLRACGFAETVNAGVSVVYTPISQGEPSLVLYFHMDGILHKVLGARGTVRFLLSTGGIPMMEYTFMGLRVAPTDTADPTADLSGFQIPEAVNDANTPTFTLHGYAALMRELTIDMAVETPYRNIVGGESVTMVDRAPAGTVSIEEPLLATKNFHDSIINHTTGAMQLIHGDTAGNIAQFDAPAVQLLNPRINDDQGVAMLNMDTRFIPTSAENDELTLTLS